MGDIKKARDDVINTVHIEERSVPEPLNRACIDSRHPNVSCCHLPNYNPVYFTEGVEMFTG